MVEARIGSNLVRKDVLYYEGGVDHYCICLKDEGGGFKLIDRQTGVRRVCIGPEEARALMETGSAWGGALELMA